MYNTVTFQANNTPSNAGIKVVVTLGGDLVTDYCDEAINNGRSVLISWGISPSNFYAVEVADDDGDVWDVCHLLHRDHAEVEDPCFIVKADEDSWFKMLNR